MSGRKLETGNANLGITQKNKNGALEGLLPLRITLQKEEQERENEREKRSETVRGGVRQ